MHNYVRPYVHHKMHTTTAQNIQNALVGVNCNHSKYSHIINHTCTKGKFAYQFLFKSCKQTAGSRSVNFLHIYIYCEDLYYRVSLSTVLIRECFRTGRDEKLSLLSLTTMAVCTTLIWQYTRHIRMRE